MNIAEEQDQLERSQAERIIAETPLFEGIEHIGVELGDDFSGDPAMWVVFRMRRDLQADDHWFDTFTQYNTDLGLKLVDSGLKRFPRSRLERAA